MELFLTNEECDSLLMADTELEWKRFNDYFRFFEVIIDNQHLNQKIVRVMKDKYGIGVSKELIIRLLRFDVGDGLPTHTFDYSTSNGSPYQDTNLIVTVFLNDDYQGGEYYLNNTKMESKIGHGIVNHREDIGKLDLITKGNSYILLCHIMGTYPTTLV